jgi:hypothetical protein
MVETTQDNATQTDAQRAMRAVQEGLERIARERARVRPEDWSTLFRQMQAVLTQLATHPFLRGDIEAELLVERILRSETLADVDARTDDLADYVLRKAEYVAELRAIAEGRPVEAPRHVAPRSSSSEVTRAAAASGPSGDDFMAGGEDADARPRRSVLRL